MFGTGGGKKRHAPDNQPYCARRSG